MDTFLDILWEHIASGFSFVGNTLFMLLQHVHFLGPAILIFLIALVTVCFTKLLKRYVVTRRYIALEKEYKYWFELRQDTALIEDDETRKRMARNIDQAKLNKAYYDYFFEGFMLNVLRKVLPIFFVFAFINEFYRPERLLEMFGREYVVSFPTSGGEQLLIGAVFWFFLCLLFNYVLFALLKRTPLFRLNRRSPFQDNQTEMSNC